METADDPPIDVLLAYAREIVGGPSCGGPDEGEALAAFLLRIWSRYRKIRLSFHGIDVVEFPCCLAFAQTLVRAVGRGAVTDKLDCSSLDDRGRFLLDRAMAFAALPPEGEAGDPPMEPQ